MFDANKTRISGLPYVKKLWRYVKPFSSDTRTSWTDGRRELLYQYRASVCWRAIKTGRCIIKRLLQAGSTRSRCPSVCLSVCLSVHLSYSRGRRVSGWPTNNCYGAVSYCFRDNNGMPWNLGQGSFKVIENITIRSFYHSVVVSNGTILYYSRLGWVGLDARHSSTIIPHEKKL